MTATGNDPATKKADSKTTKKKTAATTAFAFNEDRRLQLDTYSVAVPDGFSCGEGLADADDPAAGNVEFALWTPDTLPAEKREEGRIVISASSDIRDIKSVLDEPDSHIEEDGRFTYCYAGHKINGRRTDFYCIAGCGDDLRRFRIRFNTGISREKMERSVLEWLKRLELNERVTDPGQLELEAKKKELAAVDEVLNEYRDKREEAARQLEAAEKAYSKLLSERLIEEESTKLQIRSLENKSADKERLIADLKNKRREAREKRDDYKKKIGALEPGARAQKKALALERKALEEKRNLLEDEKAEIQEEKADKKTKLQGGFLFKKKKQLEYDAVKSRLKEKNSEISACDEGIEDLDARAAELKDNMDKERVRLRDEIARLDNREKEIRRSIGAEEEAIKKIARDISDMQERIKDYKSGITNAANEMAECKKKFDEYSEGVSGQEAKRKLISDEIRLLEETYGI